MIASDVVRELRDRRLPGSVWTAFFIEVGFAGFVTIFVLGYALTDPGGWLAIGLSAAWLVPVVVLSALALVRPRAALGVLAVATLGPIAFGVWSLVSYSDAHAYEDSHGPLSLVLTVAVATPLAVAGLSQPRAAGRILLVLTCVPVLLASIGAGSHWYEPLSVGFVLGPAVAGAVLFLLGPRSRAADGQDGR